MHARSIPTRAELIIRVVLEDGSVEIQSGIGERMKAGGCGDVAYCVIVKRVPKVGMRDGVGSCVGAISTKVTEGWVVEEVRGPWRDNELCREMQWRTECR